MPHAQLHICVETFERAHTGKLSSIEWHAYMLDMKTLSSMAMLRCVPLLVFPLIVTPTCMLLVVFSVVYQ